MEKGKYFDFLAELTELSLKYGIEIGGCGCCGSPHLSDLPKDDMGPRSGYATFENRYSTEGMIPGSSRDNVEWVGVKPVGQWQPDYQKGLSHLVCRKGVEHAVS